VIVLILFLLGKSRRANGRLVRKVIYTTIYDKMVQKGYSARRQNVSINVRVNGYDVDLVPAKHQRMVCTRCRIVGADPRPNWREHRAVGKERQDCGSASPLDIATSGFGRAPPRGRFQHGCTAERRERGAPTCAGCFFDPAQSSPARPA
jgi:hypothetical protein